MFMKAHSSLEPFVGLSSSTAQMRNSLRDLIIEITILFALLAKLVA